MNEPDGLSGGDVIVVAGHGGDLLSLAAIVIAVVSLISTFLLNSRSERKSVLDGYWFREFIGPGCVSVVLQVRSALSDGLREAEGSFRQPKDVTAFLDTINEEGKRILAATWMAEVVCRGLYERSAKILGELEDAVVDLLNVALTKPNQRTQSFAAAQAIIDDRTLALLKLLRETQEAL